MRGKKLVQALQKSSKREKVRATKENKTRVRFKKVGGWVKRKRGQVIKGLNLVR